MAEYGFFFKVFNNLKKQDGKIPLKINDL